jgi:DNA-binding winged helix-turn-helix (wHTH) protein
MAGPAGSASLFHFGVFELDLRAGELRKRGIRIKIQEQPLQILGLLIECPGEVVTREQIQKKLWDGDTFVDFDNAINSAVRKMRDALGDTSENPRFVETVARRGYRFIAPVNQQLTTAPPDQENQLVPPGLAGLEIDEALVAPEQPAVAAAAKRRIMLPWIIAGAAALSIAAGAAVWQATRAPAREVWSGVMLGGPTKAFQPRLSPDGQLLAFLAVVDGMSQLAVMKPNGDDWTPRTSDREHGCIVTAAWAADGTQIYFDRMWGYPLGIYSVPPLGGQPRMVLDEAFAPVPLRDGSLIVMKVTDQGDNQLFHFWPESARPGKGVRRARACWYSIWLRGRRASWRPASRSIRETTAGRRWTPRRTGSRFTSSLKRKTRGGWLRSPENPVVSPRHCCLFRILPCRSG